MRGSLILPLALCAGCATDAVSSEPTTTFIIESGFGDEASWVPAHLEASARVLVQMMEAPDLPPPSGIRVTLQKDPDAQSLGGWASPTELGFVSNQWTQDRYRQWILTHELVNLFAAHYAGHGGFPSDWWSNGRSPFPVYLAGLVLDELGQDDAALWLRASNAAKPDHELFWVLHERYGFSLFARMLHLLRTDDIDLGEIQSPWPHPSQVRTAYTIAYLSLAAGRDLTATVLAFGIGREPSDWGALHPEIPFEPYTVSSDEVAGIQRAREAVLAPDAPEEARRLYRTGRWREALERVRRP